MSAKLYPEVDHMALGQRYCDHVMAMTAEGLHDKSDIAGQLAWRDEQLAAKDREIAELSRKYDMWRGFVEVMSDQVTDLIAKVERAEAGRDESRRHLGELLAVIHRDGGQYQAEHGAAKATQDALSKLSSLRCELYDLRGEYEETAALFGAWKQRAEQAESERDEARECVKRLSGALSGLFGADLQTCMVERDGHDDQVEAVEAAHDALAATPEHLRR